MIILITYDVSTEDKAGKNRLRKVAKVCQNYGLRVQNSVFECEVDSALLLTIKKKLKEIILEEKDSLRFYNLGDKRKNIEHYGAKPSFDVTDVLIV